MDETTTSNNLPVWKTYLYQLQLQAPKPKPILCQKNLTNVPKHFGLEYHGMISRQEAEYLLGNEDGNFLVRESNNPPGSATLAIKFSNETKNYKVYYDGAFYVGEKRFDTIADLVHDGLITFYIEKHASNYIAMMCEENNYSESPYVASRTALLASRQKRTPIVFASPSSSIAPPPPIPPPPVPIISPFPTVHQQFNQQSQPYPHYNTNHHHIHTTIDKENRGNNAYSIQQQFLLQQQQQQQQQSIQTITSSSSKLNAQNQTKSNAIFDRFDIINSEKPHRFKSQNFKGPHWCDYCLNFMWGLVSQGVKCQDCGFQAHKKCSERTPPDCEPQMRFIKRIFGVDLTTLVKATNSIRPIIVEKCIEEIEKRKGAIECEGLYRVSGFNDAIEELKLAFDRGENVDLSDLNKYQDIHMICSLLKLYLRQLPIPLITFDVYNRLLDILNNQKATTTVNQIIEQIKSCVIELPPAHYLTLKYLIEHLVRVARYSNKNQMNHENLAIVFGPTLMRSINLDPILALKNTHKEQKITELLISNYYSIFDR